jgi:hypothetical protein
MPAADIDDVIAMASTDIATLSYGGVKSLFTQMGLWIAGVFQPGGIFPPASDGAMTPGQRPVTDWYAQHLLAKAAIEGPAVGASGVVGTSATIDAVVRVATAVKFATIAGYTSAAQQTAVVALYNTVWT